MSLFHRSRTRHSVHGGRGGFTLVEMLVVMTIFVLLLASVALAIGSLFRAQGSLQDELVQANAISRLGAQLRADAHQALSAEVAEVDALITVQLELPAETTVNYVTQPQRIIRTVSHDGTVVHREVFKLLEGTTAGWEVSGDSPSFVTLTTSYRSPELRAGVALPRVHQIEASLGLHVGGLQ